MRHVRQIHRAKRIPLGMLAIAVLSLAAVSLRVSSLGATDFTWINPVVGDFGDPGNWTPTDPAGPPGASDAACFDLPYPPYAVTFDGSYANDRLWVDRGDATFDLRGETYTLTHDFFSDNVYSVEIGSNPGETTSAKLTVINGNVSSQHVLLGRYSINAGELVVSTGAHWDCSGTFQDVGAEGTGRLTVEKGGRFDSFYMFVGGDGNARGTILVTDPGSLLDNPWFINAGCSGAARAEIRVENGGTAQIGQLRMGEMLGAGATLLVDGPDSLCNLVFTPNSTESLIVGDAGAGSVTVQNGARLLCSQNGFVGYQSGSSGSVIVQGAGSTMDVSQSLRVGHDGRGRLEVRDGASVTVAEYLNAASYGDSSGDVVVDGAGSRLLLAQSFTLGGDGDSGGLSNARASLTISGGGYVSVASETNYGFNSTSHVNGLVTGAGSTWYIGGSLSMGGYNGPTTLLTISDGGFVSAEDLLAAADVASTATILVEGPGSQLVVRNAAILGGYDSSVPGGRATVSLANGASVQVVNATAILASASLLVNGGTFTGQGGIENHGEIHVLSDYGRLEGGPLANAGLLAGYGTVASVLDNTADGEVRGQCSLRLLFTGAGNTNSGEINLAGATIEFAQDLTNDDAGFIAGRGELRCGGGLTNEGTMAFSCGLTDVYGDVANGATGRIVISGCGTTTFYDDVASDGEIRVSTGSNAVFLGELSGSGGTIGSGMVYLEGDLRPGNSPGAIAFGGDLVFGDAATLVIELAGTDPGQYDVVSVVDALSLAGTLDVQLYGGFVPEAGDSFDVLNWGALEAGATFDDVNLPMLTGLRWDDSRLYTTGVLTLLERILGDANDDGAVDDRDASILGAHWLQQGGAGWSDGDFNGDGHVNDRDAAILAAHWGAGMEEGTPDVPEPSTLALLAGAAASLGLVRRRLASASVRAR